MIINSMAMAQHEHKSAELQQILSKTVENKKVFGTSFAVKQGDFEWFGAAGNFTGDDPYFIASTTKLFTTTLIMKLRAAGKLSLDDTIAQYFDASILAGLHVYQGKEYSQTLTIRQLLSHTTGLPDYFQGKGPNGLSLEDELVRGQDQNWTFEEALARSKTMKPLFASGAKGKANYSDANFQLLGKIIEKISGQSFEQNCKEHIFKPLDLTSTYVYSDTLDTNPKLMYYKTTELVVPKAMTSFGPDGGIVSTNRDMLIFIEAFFTGKLFPKQYIDEIQVWNRIFFPMRAGIGIHQFKLPWLFNPFGTMPYFIGHSGLSGALAYYAPKENLFVVGTVNQIAHPDKSFKTMIKLTQGVLKRK